MRSSGKLAALAFVVTVMSIGVLALAACSAGSSQPATMPTSSAPTSTTPPGPGGALFAQRGRTSGTIVRIVGDVLTLSTGNGEIAVNTTANTTVEESAAGAIADLKVGQFISVAGTADAKGDIAASSVTLTTRAFGGRFSPPTGSPPDGGRPSPPSVTPTFTRPTGIPADGTFGTIAAISGNRVTLSNAEGQQTTVTIGPDTAIVVMTAASPADLRVGQAVTVSGRPPQADQGDIDAFTITIDR